MTVTAVQVARSVETPAASSDATRRSIIARAAATGPPVTAEESATVVTEMPSFETRRPRVNDSA